jgi:hypothetical protein
MMMPRVQGVVPQVTEKSISVKIKVILEAISKHKNGPICWQTKFNAQLKKVNFMQGAEDLVKGGHVSHWQKRLTWHVE